MLTQFTTQPPFWFKNAVTAPKNKDGGAQICMICELIHKPYNKLSLSSNFTIHCRLSRTGRSPATLHTLQLAYRATPLAAGWQCTLQASFARSGPNLCRWHKRLRADTMGPCWARKRTRVATLGPWRPSWLTCGSTASKTLFNQPS